MVGKTSISTRFIKGKFMKIELSNRTINASNYQKQIEVNNKIYNLNVWDTAGEEKYHALAPIFFRGSNGAIIIFDVTNRETFDRAKKWFNELKQYTEGIPYILVGNKIDLPNRAISNEEATKLAREYDCKYFEVSALLGTNVNEIFYALADIIHQHRKKGKKEKMDNFDENFNSGNNTNYGSNRNKKLQIDYMPENYKVANNRKGSCC